MSNSMFGGPGKRLGLLVGLMALVMGVGASSAFAIELTPPGPYEPEVESTVTVSGKVPWKFSGATEVGIAVCNHSEPAGTHCDLNSVSGGGNLEPVSEYEAGLNIQVRRGNAEEFPLEPWPSFSFITGAPEPEAPATLCQDEEEAALLTGTPCAVEVSFYKKVGGEPEQLGSKYRLIGFTNP